MAKVKVWERQDGGISVTPFNFSIKPDGMTDEDFIEEHSRKLRLRSELQGAKEYIMEDSDLPLRDENRNKWRIRAGKVVIDQSITLPHEIRASAKLKLKNGQPLTEAEAKLIAGV